MKHSIPISLLLMAFNVIAINSFAQWVFVEEHTDGAGGLTEIQRVHHAVISPDDKHLYCTSDWDNGLSVFSINPADGTLTLVQQTDVGLNLPHQLDITPDGQYVYVPEQNDNQVTVWRRDATTGALTLVFTYGTINQPISARVSPDGNHLYVGGTDDIRVYTINANGSLTTASTVTSGVVPGIPTCASSYIRYVREIRFSSDGLYVYTCGNGGDNQSIDVFSRNTTSGALTWMESHRSDAALCPGALPDAVWGAPYDLALTPDGNYLFHSSSFAGDVIRSNVNGGGTITPAAAIAPIGPGGSWNNTVAVTPDGSQLITCVGVNTNVYDIDAATGAATFVESHVDGAGYNELNGVMGYVFNATGRYMYAMAKFDDGITVFENPNMPIPLGVSLEGFNGVLNSENIAELTWHTLSETDLQQFELEKSLDGINYENIGTVVATGNSTVRNDYALMDPVKVDEIAYYRLKSVDEDGKYALSNVIILRNNQFCEMQVWLNDQSGKINIDANTCSEVARESSLSAALYDVNGRTIRNVALDGASSAELEANTLPSGIYFVRVQKGSKVYKQKIVIP